MVARSQVYNLLSPDAENTDDTSNQQASTQITGIWPAIQSQRGEKFVKARRAAYVRHQWH